MSAICRRVGSQFSSLVNRIISGSNELAGCSSSITVFGNTCTIPCRGKRLQIRPKLRFPLWYLKKEHSRYDEDLTRENEAFIKQVGHDKFGPPAVISGISTYQTSPLREAPVPQGEWFPGTRRCGLITRKIGQYPMWTKNGKIIWTTLLQVSDNHIVKYTPPEEYSPPETIKNKLIKGPYKYGCLLVGAESQDPQTYTKEYCGLFANAGLPPKKVLGRFMVTPNAVIQPGTPLFANHFQPGDAVDCCGKTIFRGFQGVMKRWGFKGMPASHGVTKAHRKGGNTGGGGGKARVWPGTKKAGYMGDRHRTLRGLKIFRINTKFNVLYVQGVAIPGGTNSIVYVYDSLLPLRRRTEPPKYFPTFYSSEDDQFPEDLYDDSVHQFESPSITYEEK